MAQSQTRPLLLPAAAPQLLRPQARAHYTHCSLQPARQRRPRSESLPAVQRLGQGRPRWRQAQARVAHAALQRGQARPRHRRRARSRAAQQPIRAQAQGRQLPQLARPADAPARAASCLPPGRPRSHWPRPWRVAARCPVAPSSPPARRWRAPRPAFGRPRAVRGPAQTGHLHLLAPGPAVARLHGPPHPLPAGRGRACRPP